MALAVPLMSSGRARVELGWSPRKSSEEALLELLDGLRTGAGYPTPPLDPAASGPLRVDELRTGSVPASSRSDALSAVGRLRRIPRR